MLRCKEENLFFAQIYIRFGTCKVRRLKRSIANGQTQDFCPRWTVSSLSFSLVLVRGVETQETRVAVREEKNFVSCISTLSHLAPQSRAFRVSRVLLDRLRKKRDWLPVVHVHLGNKFLVQSIVNPQVDVSPPQSLFLSRGDICYCSFIHFPYSVWLCFALHQTQVVKPCVVIAWVCFHFLENTSDTY